MRSFGVLVLVLASCSDPARPNMPPDAAPVEIDAAPPAGPIDFTFVLPGIGDRKLCLVRDRVAFGLHQDPEALLATSTDEWCPHDKDCDGVCAAYVGLTVPGPTTAEFFVWCVPERELVLPPNCVK